MRPYSLTSSFFASMLTISALLVTCLNAQSTAALLGRVVDSTGAIVAGVKITVRNRATSLERVTQTDSKGNYQIAALPVGTYRVEVRARGFKTAIVESLIVEVGQSVVQDFELRIGDLTQEVTVTPGSQAIERTTISVGTVVARR